VRLWLGSARANGPHELARLLGWSSGSRRGRGKTASRSSSDSVSNSVGFIWMSIDTHRSSSWSPVWSEPAAAISTCLLPPVMALPGFLVPDARRVVIVPGATSGPRVRADGASRSRPEVRRSMRPDGGLVPKGKRCPQVRDTAATWRSLRPPCGGGWTTVKLLRRQPSIGYGPLDVLALQRRPRRREEPMSTPTK
jgi:hypothetical protein